MTLTIRSSVRTIGERAGWRRFLGDAALVRFLAAPAGVAPVAAMGAGPTAAGAPNAAGREATGGREARRLVWRRAPPRFRLPLRGALVVCLVPVGRGAWVGTVAG
jgi:hypothetical protein